MSRSRKKGKISPSSGQNVRKGSRSFFEILFGTSLDSARNIIISAVIARTF